MFLPNQGQVSRALGLSLRKVDDADKKEPGHPSPARCKMWADCSWEAWPWVVRTLRERDHSLLDTSESERLIKAAQASPMR